MTDYKLNEMEEETEKKEEEGGDEAPSTIHFSIPQGDSEKSLRTVAVFGEINEEKSADITSGIYYLWKNAPELYTVEELEED